VLAAIEDVEFAWCNEPAVRGANDVVIRHFDIILGGSV